MYINLGKLKIKNVFGQINLYQRGMSLEVALKHHGVMSECCFNGSSSNPKLVGICSLKLVEI